MKWITHLATTGKRRPWWPDGQRGGLLAAALIALITALGAPGMANGAPMPSIQQQTTPDATVKASALNLRSGPGTNYTIITVLRQGETVDVIGQYGSCSWLQVRTAQGVEGWISGAARFVTLHIACADLPATTPSAADAPAATPAAATPTPAAPERPATGAIFKDTRPGSALGELTVNNRSDEDAFFKIETEDGVFLFSFYVRAHENAWFKKIPDGVYVAKFATGSNWQNDQGRFEHTSGRWRFEKEMAYTTSSSEYSIWELTLNAFNGNARVIPLGTSEEF